MREWAGVVKTVLTDDGSLFLNVGGKPTDPTVPFQVLQAVQSEFVLQNVIHWIKSISIEKADVGNYPNLLDDISVGHYKPINSPRFINDNHEYIFHLTKRGDVKLDRLAIGVPYQDKTNVSAGKAPAAMCVVEATLGLSPTKPSKTETGPSHPATFPVKLAEMCIKLHGVARTGLVLDPFLGLGHSALAARKLGKAFVGFEIDAEYYAEAMKRLTA